MQSTFIRLVKNGKQAVNIKVVSKTKAELYYGHRMTGNTCGFIQEITAGKAKKLFYYYLQNGYSIENAPGKSNTNKIDYEGVSLQTLLSAVSEGKQDGKILKKHLASNLKMRLEVDMESAIKFYEQDIKSIYLKTSEGDKYLIKVATDYIKTFDCK